MGYKNKEDQAAASRRHYLKNKEKMKARAVGFKRQQRILLKKIVEEAKSVPCKDCGVIYPHHVMDFDHLRDKKFNISEISHRAVSVKHLLEEIAKCEVVCSNCHRLRTFYSRKSASSPPPS